MLESPNFTVTTGNPVRSAKADESGSLVYDARTRNLEVSFDLASEGEVLVQAFDAGGRLLATLVKGKRAAGSHRISVFSNRLEAKAPVVFRLTAGEKSLSLAASAVNP